MWLFSNAVKKEACINFFLQIADDDNEMSVMMRRVAKMIT